MTIRVRAGGVSIDQRRHRECPPEDDQKDDDDLPRQRSSFCTFKEISKFFNFIFDLASMSYTTMLWISLIMLWLIFGLSFILPVFLSDSLLEAASQDDAVNVMSAEAAPAVALDFFREGKSKSLEALMKRMMTDPKRISHYLSILSNKNLSLSSALSSSSNSSSLLEKFLIPRPIGSKNHLVIENLILKHCRKYDYILLQDAFEEETVIGRQRFTNLIALNTLSAKKYLLFAAHYDSKRMHPWQGPPDEETFIGATDSAASCVLLLDLMRNLKKAYEEPNLSLAKSEEKHPQSLGLMFVFFDGEESFHDWSSTDSLYGSRHLATIYARQQSILKDFPFSLLNVPKNRAIPARTCAFQPDSIRLFILLDLLGHHPPSQLYNLHKESSTYFQFFAFLEQFLHYHHLAPPLNQIQPLAHSKDPPPPPPFPMFLNADGSHFQIDDDHKPFQALNIPILHLIPVPYPPVWHTMADNHAALNQTVLFQWQKLLALFLFSILNDP
jgi:glutaminyl-peptide cyclotransferase